jgi:hypothetical protein
MRHAGRVRAGRGRAKAAAMACIAGSTE